MSVYKPKGSPFYHYDFELGGDRFYGSTKKTERRKAEKVEEDKRDAAKKAAKAAQKSSASLQIDDVAGRYWSEVGQHHAGHKDTWAALERLVEYFGPPKLITEISDSDVAQLVAWRRGHRKHGKLDAPLITNATVNRSTTEVLKKLFTRAKKAWGVKFDHEPNWTAHWLEEPEERERELVGDEGARLEAATREDHGPFFAFAGTAALRLSECLLRWSEVDWDGRQIRKPGKGGKLVVVPITPTIRSILWPLRGHHPEHVFTYVARRTRGKLIRGQRYPLTYSGVKSAWKRLRKQAGVVDFRFHDYRHDVGTKLLRQTGNLKLVQKALNHRNIKTTTRYAHVLGDEVAEALEGLAKSRKKSRNASRKVA
ncbi:tyrosine-type recombinase/integrase [Reyranella soli]|uniref:Integrase n=1 Tax=Reyranella soli TaxID=1230389 RepID=A0A512NEF4_9HYPH|nr:site-specific integrase [Reyranella soli]GEP57325.1 integrase [Reyranella soli]